MKNLWMIACRHKALLLIALISLALKIVLLAQNPVINRDAVVYIAAAQKFSEGLFVEGAQHYYMPLYPLLLTGTHLIVPDWILAGQLLNLLILLLCLIPLYLLTDRLFNRPGALAAALLFAVLPVFNEPVTSIIRDPLFLLLILSALALLAYQQDKSSLRGIVGLSFLLFIATLIRIEGVVVLLLVPLLIVWHRGNHNLTKRLAISFGMAGGVALLLASVVWLFSQTDFVAQSRLSEVVRGMKGLITLELFSGYQALLAQLKEMQDALPRANLKNNLLQSARYYAPLIYLVGLIEIFIKEIFPTSLLALWALRWSFSPILSPPRNIIVWPWIAFFLLNLLFCIAKNFSVTRYLWIPIVLTLPFIGYGMSLWGQRLTGRSVALVLMMCLFFVTPLVKTLSYMERADKDASIREAGQWLKAYDPAHSMRVFYNDRRLSLYAQRVYEHAERTLPVFSKTDMIKHLAVDADLFLLSVRKTDRDAFTTKDYFVLEMFEDDRSAVLVLKKNE